MKEAIVRAVTELRRMSPPNPPTPFAKTVVGLLVGTAVLALLFYVLERLFPEQQGQPAVRKGTKIDAIYWFFDFLIAKRLVTIVMIVVLIAAVALKMPRLSSVSQQPLWLQALEALFVADLCGYWSHRLMHEIPFLWRLHRVHHSSEQVDWLSSARVHPLESVWNKLIALLPLFLMGFSPKITVFFGPIIGLYPIFLHSNVRWGYGAMRYLVASPAFHRWHHSADAVALNKNYSGLLPLFDLLFGTAHFPGKSKPERYGLAGARAPETFWRQIWWPFRA
jgi:sterol desaturase/sphingolipid hydroxylase (fatty acid hydroxylase superfamily)